MQGAWLSALRRGLLKWSTLTHSYNAAGVSVEFLAPRCPILFTSGATPGPFYHSHPHDPREFDHLAFDMASQVQSNLATIRDCIYAAEGPSSDVKLSEDAQFINWVSRNGDGFAGNAAVTEAEFAQAGLSDQCLGTFEVGGNVSDRRFLLETFAMHCLPGSWTSDSHITRVDLSSQFDSVSPDGSTYTVGDKKYFMPYVPGYVTSGPGELALFSLTAEDAGADGAAQVPLVVEKLQSVLAALGITFDDVVVLWNRCANLDKIEEAVLMTRSRDFGLVRPLAESVLEIVEADPNPDGAAIEYIVVAKLPRSLAEVRSLA